MHIVLLGNAGLAPALRRAGHETLTVGSMGGSYDIMLQHPLAPGRLQRLISERSFAADALVFADDGCLPAVFGLEDLPFPLVFYSIDTFCNPWHVPYAYAFDYVLTAQPGFLPLFANEGHPTTWFPLFYPAKFSAELSGITPDQWLNERDIPVAFVGTLRPKNIPQRFPFLQEFRKRHSLVMLQGEYAPIFRRARIVLNQTAVSEVNYRCFEAMGCGAALLTDSVGHGFQDLFAEGKNVLPPYSKNDPSNAVANASYWLEHPQKLAEIAIAGTALVAEKHTDDVRAGDLVKLCLRLIEERVHEKRFAQLVRRKVMLASAYGAIASEVGPELASLGEIYFRMCQDLSG